AHSALSVVASLVVIAASLFLLRTVQYADADSGTRASLLPGAGRGWDRSFATGAARRTGELALGTGRAGWRAASCLLASLGAGVAAVVAFVVRAAHKTWDSIL